MYKKSFILIVVFLIALILTSCSENKSSDINSSPQPHSRDIQTLKNYKVNDEIEIGNNADIIVKQGIIDQIYWRRYVQYLGADNNGNIITFNFDTNNIESTDSNHKLSILMNIMEGRKNHVYAINKFGDIVAWSECPHGDMDPIADSTKGANWGLYYADLNTKKITKIDGDKGISIPDGTQYGYLAPNRVLISPDHISYISFDYNPEGKVTSVIKLSTISSKSLEIVDYLNEDLTKYAFGYPNISGDKMVWCKALVNPDGTYTGHSYLYDLKSKVKSKLITDENIINPKINDNYIFAEGKPNKTFYDSEICIYDISKNQWVYKINNGYSQYNMSRNVYLSNSNTRGNYLLWSTGVMRALVLFNKADNKLYNIVSYSDNKEITSPMLLDGGLLIWFEKPWGSPGNAKPTFKYCYLK